MERNIFNMRRQMEKTVDKKVKKILSVLPQKKQRHLKGLAVARIYHNIQAYPKVIKYLKLYLRAKNVAVAHKLIAHSYRLLETPALQNALHHYQRCIQLKPQQPSVIKEVCKLLLYEESIFNMDCANYWLDLAASNNLGDDKAVILLRLQVILKESNDDDTEGASTSKIQRFHLLGRTLSQFLKNNIGEFLLENDKICVKIIAAVAAELGNSGVSDSGLFEVLESAKELCLTIGMANDEAQDSPKANKEPAVFPPAPDAFSLPSTPAAGNSCSNKEQGAKSTEAADPPRLSFLQGQKPKQPGNKPELVTWEKNEEMSLEDTAKWLQKMSIKEQEKPAGADPGNALNLSTSSSFGLAPTGEFSFKAPNTSASVDQMTKTSSIPVFGPSSFKFTAPAVVAVGKQPDNKPELVPSEKNDEMLVEDIAKLVQKQSIKKQKKPAGFDPGNTLNLSTSSSSGKSSFGLAPTAFPVSGEFSFKGPNTSASVAQMTKTSSIPVFGPSSFKFTAPAVVAKSASLGLSSSISKPTQEHHKIDEKLEELLFVHHAKLYRLTDGEFKNCGQGDVKIWRHIKTKELHVVMQQEKLLNLCLSHSLNTDVVYKPMNKKSWTFAAHDFSEGKGSLERFTVRFKTQCEAQEFNSTVKKALNGTAKAIQNKN